SDAYLPIHPRSGLRLAPVHGIDILPTEEWNPDHGPWTMTAPSSEPIPETPPTIIGPPTGWQLINFAELWQYRDLLYFLAWRDVKVRYKQTVLGIAWAVLQPALMMCIFYVIFFVVAGTYNDEQVPYPLFVFSALLPWSFFATS